MTIDIPEHILKGLVNGPLNEWEVFLASDGELSIGKKNERSTLEIARDVIAHIVSDKITVEWINETVA